MLVYSACPTQIDPQGNSASAVTGALFPNIHSYYSSVIGRQSFFNAAWPRPRALPRIIQ